MWPNFLFSTTHNVMLFKDNKVAVMQNLPVIEKSFYGITWNTKGKLYLSSGDFVYSLGINNEFLKLSYKGRGIHQIFFDNNRLYVVDTGNNYVTVLDDKENVLFKHKWLYGEPYDVEHVNSIFKYNNYYYVCAHNHKNPSFIMKFDSNFNFNDVYREVGFQNHNIYVENDLMTTLSSKECKIYQLDLKNKKRYEISIKMDDIFPELSVKDKFFRGLAKNKDYFLIGMSVSEDCRDRREIHKAYILRFDNNFNFIDYFQNPLPSQIKDIRIIDELDYCHIPNIFSFV